MENLASEFGVTWRTIQRDIQKLSLEHPLITVTGRHGGGVYVMKGCRADRMYLTVRQQNLLERLLKLLAGEDKLVMQEILQTFALKH